MIKKRRKIVLLSVMIMLTISFMASCKTSDSSNEYADQPYREFGKFKYDEKLGGVYQLVDYNIDSKKGDNITRIELIFVSNYEQITNSGDFIIPWGSFWLDTEGSDDVYDKGEWKNCTALGNDIVDGSRMYYTDFKIQDVFKKKLETEVNHRDLFGEEFLTVFRIDEFFEEKYGLYKIFVYHGLNEKVVPGTITEPGNPEFKQDFIENRIVMTYTKR